MDIELFSAAVTVVFSRVDIELHSEMVVFGVVVLNVYSWTVAIGVWY